MKYYQLPHFLNNQELKNQQGFTLIEMLVVLGVIAFLSFSLIGSFSRTRIDTDQTSNLIMATIREAQTRSVSSSTYSSYSPCGYGIHYVNSTNIIIYVGPNAATASPSCSSMDKRYNASRDSILRTQTITDSKVEILSSFSDIFFLPPDPKTYLNNSSSLGQAPIGIQVGPPGESCSSNCRTVYVYPSGKIESQ